MTLTIEIRKAGFENKGAAMMLIAALEAIRSHRPDARVAVAPDGGSPFESRSRLGLWQKVELIRHGFDLGRAITLVPSRLRDRYGLVTESEVDVMLDAAGLAYSDQWGSAPTVDLARRLARWKQAKRTVILLPQAFGPFENSEIRSAIARVADLADLIFARDVASLAHLEAVVGARENIRLAPDFTNLLAPVPPSDALGGTRPVAIVPNARMLDKTTDHVRKVYPSFLGRAVALCRTNGLDPFFLIHEGRGDYELAARINAGCDKSVPICVADDPREAKGVLGACYAVIASRYHALVSAMSQSVPAIGTGWSHKYSELFTDYGCPENLLEVSESFGALETVIASLADPLRRIAAAQSMDAAASAIKRDTLAMWADVFDIIDSAHPRPGDVRPTWRC